MDLKTFWWEGKNTLQSYLGYSLRCTGLFRFTIERRSDGRSLEFQCYFDSRSGPQIVVLLTTPFRWSDGTIVDDHSCKEISYIIDVGFPPRGYQPQVYVATEQEEQEKFGQTLLLFSEMRKTQAGAFLDTKSSSEEMSDDERKILWEEALAQFMRANPPGVG